MSLQQGLGFEVSGSATVKKAAPTQGLVIRGHVVCRDAGGQIKWECDTVPVFLGLGAEVPERVDLELALPSVPENDR